MGKEKTHINIVVIGHVDSGRDRENFKEGETVRGTRRIGNILIMNAYLNSNTGTGSCGIFCFLLNILFGKIVVN